MSPLTVGDTVAAVEKDDEEAREGGSMATPRVSSQCATFGPSLSRRSGMEPHAAEYLPAPPSPSPCHTAITFVSEMCGNGGARPRVGPPAKWAREARRPDGLERCL